MGHIGGGGGGGAGRVLTNVTSFSVSSDITAGSGGSASLDGGGGGGGVGLVVYDASTVTSTNTILGGNGGNTVRGNAGQGGAGVFLVGANTSHIEVGQHAGGIFTNNRTVQGGTGGSSTSGSSGSGGHGVLANNAVINNFSTGSIRGGNAGAGDAAGSNGGHGIYTHSSSSYSTEITNHGVVSGGNGTGTSGLGGYGVQLTGDNGKIYNTSTITGGTNGDGTTRAAVKIGTGGITSANNEVHMTAAALFVGDVDASDATNTKLVLSGSDNGSFDMSRLVSTDGAASNEFINFTRLGKEGVSTWTLTGTASGNQDWEISAGTLIGSTETIKGNADITLGASLEFNQTSNATFINILSGNGTVGKSGSSSLTLSNTGSTFNGLFDITAGTLIGNTATIKGNVDIASSASLEFNQATDGVYSGTLRGNGTFVKSGTGALTLTNTSSTFTGLLDINAGKLIGDTDSLNSNADIASGATLEFNQTSDGTYSWELRGNGAFVKSGSGKLTLTNTGSTFTGTNYITEGILSGDTNTIKSNTDIASGASLEFHQTTGGAYSGSLSGNGTVVKSGSGKLTLTNAASTFSGTNNIAAGTLAGDTSTIKGNADIASGASLEFNQTSDGIYTGLLSGSGTLVKSGSGALTLANGSSNFTGANDVAAGVLAGDTNTIRGSARIASGASMKFNQTSDGTYDGQLSGTGTLVKSGTGTLTITSIHSTFTGTNIVEEGRLKGDANTIKSNATIASGASLEFNQTADGTFAGELSGDGTLVKSGSGTLALSNTNNSFTGTNVITEGTLQGTTDTIRGDADIASGAKLEFNQTVDGVYAGNLSGSGDLVNSGGGVLTFSGSNTGFAGSTAIDTGIMRMDNPLALGSGAISNNAELELSFSGPFPNVLSGSGNLTVDAADKTVEFTTVKTYTGATTVAAGTLKASAQDAFASSILLDIKSNAAFAATAAQNIKDFHLAENASAHFNNNNLSLEKGEIRGGLADVADLIKVSPGELDLRADLAIGGNFSHQEGGITIAHGKTMAVAGDANFATDAVLRVHPGEVTALRADTVSFAGAGPIIDLIGYSGTDSYVVAEAESGSIGSNYQVRIGGSPVASGIDLQTFALPNLVRQNDDHQLVATTALVWNNTDPASAHGVFDIPGRYMIDSALTDNDNPAAMYSEDSYAWDGKSLAKRGSGKLILGQHNAYTGLTTVEAGTLQLGVSPQREGGIGSGGVMVKAGGRLEGFGRIDSDVSIESGGTLMAGDSATTGIISVKNLAMASGARFIIPAAGSIHVDDHAKIDDAVEFALQSEDITADTPRTLLNAGSLSGLTPDKEVELAFITYILKPVDPGGRIELNLDVQEVRELVNAAITPNQVGVATALDAWNGGDNQLREKILLLFSQEEATQALDLLANELSSTTRSHLLALNHQFWNYLSGSARTVRTADLPDISVSTGDAYAALSPDFSFSRGFFAWAQAGGTVMRSHQSADSARGKTTGYDFAVGLEGGGDNLRLGLIFRRADSRVEVDEHCSRSDIDSHNIGMYALTSAVKGPGRLLISLGLSGGLHHTDTRRDVGFSAYSERLTAHYQAKSALSFLEAGYLLSPSTISSVEPYANLTLNTLWSPTVTEDGGIASTRVESDRHSTLAATVGGRFTYTIANWSSLDFNLAFRHTFGNINPPSRMYFANDPGSNSFTTVGSGLTRDEAVLGIAFRVMPREYLEISLGYQAAFGKRSAYQRGTFTAGLLF